MQTDSPTAHLIGELLRQRKEAEAEIDACNLRLARAEIAKTACIDGLRKCLPTTLSAYPTDDFDVDVEAGTIALKSPEAEPVK